MAQPVRAMSTRPKHTAFASITTISAVRVDAAICMHVMFVNLRTTVSVTVPKMLINRNLSLNRGRVSPLLSSK